MQDNARWKNKVTMVTGATTGIGEAIAYRLAEMGLSVVLVGRRAAQLEAVAENVRARGVEAIPIRCDIGDPAAIATLFDQVRERVGRLDVLINNAGVGYQSPIGAFDTAELKQVLDINVLGTAVCIREALSFFQNRPDTAIVTISSMAAHRIPPGGYGMYSASKHAVRAIMEALRLELAEIRSPTKVASISPGTVATEFHKLFVRTGDDPTEALPFERLSPADVADAVGYLLSTPAHVQINDMLIRPTGQVG